MKKKKVWKNYTRHEQNTFFSEAAKQYMRAVAGYCLNITPYWLYRMDSLTGLTFEVEQYLKEHQDGKAE